MMTPGGDTHPLDLDRLVDLFRPVMPEEEAETIAHALVDMRECMTQIYTVILPAMLHGPHPNPEKIEEYLWDIRDQVRHLDYHIHDAFLKE